MDSSLSLPTPLTVHVSGTPSLPILIPYRHVHLNLTNLILLSSLLDPLLRYSNILDTTLPGMSVSQPILEAITREGKTPKRNGNLIQDKSLILTIYTL